MWFHLFFRSEHLIRQNFNYVYKVPLLDTAVHTLKMRVATMFVFLSVDSPAPSLYIVT
jgi:hypothetical protein